MRTKFIRTRFIASHRVQLKYLFLLIFSIFVPLLFVAGCLYYLLFTIMAEQLGIPESIAYHLFPVIEKINLILAAGLPPIFLILILWGVAVSHRFTGPLERLEKELDKISKSGDYTNRIMVRKGDDIKPIADSINQLLDRIEEKTK